LRGNPRLFGAEAVAMVPAEVKMTSAPPALLNELKAAARSKHLRLGARGVARSLLAPVLGRGNKIAYRLPASGRIPRDFIRQEPWEIEYLFSLARRAKRGIVETGRFNGGSAMVFAAANTDVPIWSIDILPQNDERLKRMCGTLAIGQNLNLIVGDSQKTSYPQVGQYDLLFIDGDHSFQGCLNDLENWWPALERGGQVVLHDCYLGNEVQDAVVEFLSRHEATVVQPPWRGREHWRYPTGSLCHFSKP
jgi:predicted O-methyltransferase YrrM